MKRYRLVEQDGVKREILGETATELDIGDVTLLTIKGDINDWELQGIKREIERLATHEILLVLLPEDADIKLLILEEMDEEEE